MTFGRFPDNPRSGLAEVFALGRALLIANVFRNSSVHVEGNLGTPRTLSTDNHAVFSHRNSEVMFRHAPSLPLASDLWKFRLHHYRRGNNLDSGHADCACQ